MTDLIPDFANVQAHYDLSDDFYALFLDPSMTYSCAYFEPEDLTLEQAQQAKIELALGKCDLKPGARLLDIGCGWGATMRRAVEHHDVDVIGLTLSRNQFDHVQRLFADQPGPRRAEVRLRGWEEFDEPVDRIVSIGAFEHFGQDRYRAFFDHARELLPADGRMLLHTIVSYDAQHLQRAGIDITIGQLRRNVAFGEFLRTEIFPGGHLPTPAEVETIAEAAGFRVERVHALRPHYARTLDCWAANLAARRQEAVAVTSDEVYQRYQRYLTGCADWFRLGYIDVMQFTLAR